MPCFAFSHCYLPLLQAPVHYLLKLFVDCVSRTCVYGCPYTCACVCACSERSFEETLPFKNTLLLLLQDLHGGQLTFGLKLNQRIMLTLLGYLQHLADVCKGPTNYFAIFWTSSTKYIR